jgi:hypothetical protein
MMSWNGMRGRSAEFCPRRQADEIRVAVSSLLDLESKYNRAIEEKTLLEQEIVAREELEIETQRLRDEIRGKLDQPSPESLS